MKYIDAVQVIGKIEKEHDVMSIKYNGVALWPYFRIYLLDRISDNFAVPHNFSALKLVLSSLFQYNPLRFFKKHKIWNYSSSITRKKIGEKYEHHVSGYLHKSPYSDLTIEQSSPGIRRISKADIPEKNIVSGSWPLVFTAILEILSRPINRRIEGEDILIKILERLEVSFNYKQRLGWLIAQKRTTDFFLAIGHKPELMIMECYYTQMGRIWSAHNHGIPVVELQHGVLNRSHIAYNSIYHSDLFYPDEICVYGEEEYKYFTEEETHFSNKVTITGLYLLDRSATFFSEDIFAKEREKYKMVIVVAGQRPGEEQLSSFVDDVAKNFTDVLFVYIPRRSGTFSFSSPNVVLKVGVNIYEYLKWCDIHVTISSTTGLEAHYFKKPVVFCDFENVAKEYYGGIISEKNGAFYLHTQEEFLKLLPTITPNLYIYRELFAHGSEERMEMVLRRYLCATS